MNITDLTDNLNQFNSQSQGHLNDLNERISSIKDAINEGFTLPTAIHGVAEGIKGSKGIFGKVGKYLVGDDLSDIPDKIKNNSNVLSKISRNGISEIRKNGYTNNPNIVRQGKQPSGLNTDTTTSLKSDTPPNMNDLERPRTIDDLDLGDTSQRTRVSDLFGEDKMTPQALLEKKQSEFGNADKSIIEATKKVASNEESENMLKSVGKGLIATDETGIPILSEISDVATAGLGLGELFADIGRGRKEKQLEEQKKQLEEKTPPPQQILTGSNQPSYQSSTGGGVLSF